MTLIKEIYADFFFLLKGWALEQKDTLISINPRIYELKSSQLLFCERICEAKISVSFIPKEGSIL